MEIFHNIEDYSDWHSEVSQKKATIGFVPTMGALHNGHLSLIQASRRANDYTVCSIYVNPTQFNDKGDYNKYPRSLEDDTEILTQHGCDVLFAPESEEMYPDGEESSSKLDLGEIVNVMEGEFRPGHFDGVVNIVERLFRIMQPGKAYFGQKDFQQLAVIRKMNEELGLPVKIIGCPTVREDDGLAMSSRNLLLSSEQRTDAPAIYQSLIHCKEKQVELDVEQIKQEFIEEINSFENLKVEYIEIADSISLQPIDTWNSAESVVCCVAVHAGDVRLIDNIILYN